MIISQYYDPEPIPKPAEVAAELQRRGHDVHVITGLPNYPSGNLAEGYSLTLLKRERRQGIPVLRVFELPYHGRSVFGRVLNYGTFMLAAAAASFAVPRPDVIYVWHPPLTVGITAWLVGSVRRSRFVFDLQDIWPDEMLISGLIREGLTASLLRRMEKFVYSRASQIIAITKGAKANLVAKGVPPQKISVIPHWIYGESATRTTPAARDQARRELGANGTFIVTFAGNLGFMQGLDTMLRAAKLLGTNATIAFRIVGDGTARLELEKLTRELGLTNVRFLPPQRPAALPAFLEASDCLLVHLRAGPLTDLVLPAKTLNYLAAGRPLIAAMTGTVADVVHESGAGVVVPPDDPAQLARAVEHLANLSAVERNSMGEKGRAYVQEHFGRDKLMDELETILVEVARRD